jgi:hypothetical protein
MSSSSERLENTVDPKLLEILVCPRTKGPLEFDAAKQELISRSAKLAYRQPDHVAGRGAQSWPPPNHIAVTAFFDHTAVELCPRDTTPRGSC